MSETDFSRLRLFIADHEVDGPDSVLVIQGFADRAEIERFEDALMQAGVLKPAKETRKS